MGGGYTTSDEGRVTNFSSGCVGGGSGCYSYSRES